MGNKVRVLLLIGQLSIGGAEKQLILLAKNMDKTLYEVQVCSLSEKNQLMPELQDSGIVVHVLERIVQPDVTRLWRLHRIIKEFRPDVIHSYLFVANAWARLLGAWMKIPVVISERNASIVKPWWAIAIDRALKPYSELLIANSQAGANMVVERGEMDKSKIVIIHNGIELLERRLPMIDLDELKGKLGLSGSWPILGLIGRLDYQKNHEAFFRVVKRLKNVFPGVMGLCIGEGMRRNHLESEVARLHLDENVMLLGNRGNASAIMQVLDVLVLASRWEGTPNVLLEGMLYRRPIVATAVGGVPEIIRDGNNGFLVAVDDDETMVNRITTILCNPERANLFCEQGYKRLLADFSVARMVEKTQFCYQRVVQTAQPGVGKL